MLGVKHYFFKLFQLKITISIKKRLDIAYLIWVHYKQCVESFMPRMRKGAVQIRFEILEFLYYHSRQLRTHVWRKATSLSYDDFLKHLSYLKEKGLVEETEEDLCRITKKGRNVYNELRNALSSIL